MLLGLPLLALMLLLAWSSVVLVLLLLLLTFLSALPTAPGLAILSFSLLIGSARIGSNRSQWLLVLVLLLLMLRSAVR